VDSQQSSATVRHGWQCPECGRQIPRTVDVCRCGVERARLEALGFNFDVAQLPSGASRAGVHGGADAIPGLAGTLFGYRSDATVSRVWRIVLTVIFAGLVGAAGYWIVKLTHQPLEPIRENVLIVTTLDEHTQASRAGGGNTIPAFLTTPGTIGVLEPSMTATDELKHLSDADLRKGFCSPSLAKQIRYEYPGFYESWPDDKLERVVLEKYPDYQDRLCILPSELGVSPDDVVKYQLRPRTIVELVILWSRTALITLVFAMALLNVYYRLLVNRLAN
jgi:hypothetical protein